MKLIIIAALLLVITFLLLIYALFRRDLTPFTRLEDLYRIKFKRESAQLLKEREAELLSEEEYQVKYAALAHDLLAVADENRRTLSSRFLLLSIAFMMVIGTAIFIYYWTDGYQKEEQLIDAERFSVRSELKRWVESLDINQLREGVDLEELNPPKSLIEQGRAGFFALNQISSEQNHKDLRYLYILANAYTAIGALDIANEVYIRLYESEEPEHRLYPNAMFLYLQLEMNDFKLDARLENLYDQMVQRHSDNERLILQYGMILYQNQKFEKAIALFEYLASTLDGEDQAESRALFVGMIADMKMQALAQARNSVEASVTLDIKGIDFPETAQLYLYLREEGSAGGPPLAARRIAVSEAGWPINVRLSSSDILMPTDKELGDYEALTLSARISLNGDPISKAGDLESSEIKVEHGALNQLVIDRVKE